jgi:hypothetical protein
VVRGRREKAAGGQFGINEVGAHLSTWRGGGGPHDGVEHHLSEQVGAKVVKGRERRQPNEN